MPEKAKSRRYSAAYKKRILEEYEQLDKAGKGALLRREGLYSSLITNWRQQREKGALQALEWRRAGPGQIRAIRRSPGWRPRRLGLGPS